MPDQSFEFDPEAYGRAVAGDYDELYADDLFDTAGAVACLKELAGDGPVLELGVGTGRLALPLQQQGFKVHGLDASEEMLEQLRGKPGGREISLTVADFSDFKIDGAFSLVILAVNTIFALPDQDAQVRCFRCVADHLRPGGRFVVEAFVPNPSRFQEGHSVRVRTMTDGRVTLEVARIDPVTQFIYTNQVHLRDGDVRVHAANHRYAWPAEMDLMARMAGLDLEDRWSDWQRRPYEGTSPAHVSVYVRSATRRPDQRSPGAACMA